jgi:hypothetical protein
MSMFMRPNFKVFNDPRAPLYIVDGPSNKILNQTLTGGNSLTWTPANGKSIYLTAIQAASTALLTLAVNVTLARGSTTFLEIELTTVVNTYNATFFSPLKFNVNETVKITNNTALTSINTTLFGYEL